jgi:hypothetical protein
MFLEEDDNRNTLFDDFEDDFSHGILKNEFDSDD